MIQVDSKIEAFRNRNKQRILTTKTQWQWVKKECCPQHSHKSILSGKLFRALICDRSCTPATSRANRMREIEHRSVSATPRASDMILVLLDCLKLLLDLDTWLEVY